MREVNINPLPPNLRGSRFKPLTAPIFLGIGARRPARNSRWRWRYSMSSIPSRRSGTAAQPSSSGCAQNCADWPVAETLGVCPI
ncbi:hypothetical protein QF001_000546 [Paraburkholderia youngii]